MKVIPQILGRVGVVITLTSQESLGHVVLSTSDRDDLLVSHMTSVHCLGSLGSLCLFSVFCEPRLSNGGGAGGML